MPLLPIHGHAALRTRFDDAIKRNVLPGSLLLHGPLGVGKQRLALWLGQRLLCTGPEPRPCGSCQHCRYAMAGTHPDIHWYFPRPSLKSGDGTPAKVNDDLREAIGELPEPLKSILVRSHWNNERLVDIAEDMGISFQRVAQYKVEAVTALAAWFATLYEAVPAPDAGLPGAVRRAAFCAALSARSTWRTRLEAGDTQQSLVDALSGVDDSSVYDS